jgi:hypothetical protein
MARRAASSRRLGVAATTHTATKATRTPARHGATALDINKHFSVLDPNTISLLVCSLHVLLALIDNESITALALLDGRVTVGSNIFDNADALDGTVAAELALEIVGGDAVSEAGDEEGFEGVTLNLGIFTGLVCRGLAFFLSP